MFSDHSGIKLEIISRKIIRNFPNTWKLNNKLLNNPGSKRKSQGKCKIYIELNENKIQYIKIYGMWLKLRRKFVVLNSCIRKKENSQINNPRSYLKNLEKKNKISPKQAAEENNKIRAN